MSAKQTLPDQHLLLHERWPSDCCLCHHEGAITRLTVENERLRGLERLLLTDHQLGVVVDEWPMPAEREAAAQELARRAALKEPE